VEGLSVNKVANSTVVFHAASKGDRAICGLWIGGMQCEIPGHHQCAEDNGHTCAHACSGCSYKQENVRAKVRIADPDVEQQDEDEAEPRPQAEPQRTLEAFA
jgi:hypothetical protein